MTAEPTLLGGTGETPTRPVEVEELEVTIEAELADSLSHAGAEGKPHVDELHRQIRGGLGLIALVTIFWTGLVYLWLMAHGLNLGAIFGASQADLEAIARFNFLGLSPDNPRPSILSLNLEIVMWSTFGVVIHTVFLITLELRRRQFAFLESVVRAVGDLITGVALALVVILLLRVVRFNVGGADMTLAEADYETVAVLAFVLGFYHEDARRLLSRFRNQLLSEKR